MEQLSLFKWGADEAMYAKQCYCWHAIDTGQACKICQMAQLADFNYVSAYLTAFGRNNDGTNTNKSICIDDKR